MGYATVSDYVAFVGEQEAIDQSNLDDPNALVVNESVILRWLDAASAEIDGHLATRYALPIPLPIPAMLNEIACVIARKNLDRYMRREHVQEDYKDAVARLVRMGKGQEILTGVDGLPPAIPADTRTYGTVSYRPGDSMFNRQNLSGYSRDGRWQS